MKTSVIAILTLVLSGTTAAAQQNPIADAEVRQAMRQTEQAIQQSAENMNKTFSKVMPEIAESMNKSISEILGTFPQLFSVMEQNKIFSKTSEQMLKELQSSLDEMQISADNYKIENFNNKLSLTGSQNRDNIDLDFMITQDPMALALTKEYLNNKQNGIFPEQKISTLSGKEIKLVQFNIENINNNKFLCYDEDNYTFIIGNQGYENNIKIETRGKDHKQQAEDFIKNLK